MAVRRCMEAICAGAYKYIQIWSSRTKPDPIANLPKMAEPSKNPTPKHEALSNDNTDRISKLPEPLLYHILSFLTTKEAAKTSVLSKQWQYLWTCVPVLDVNAKDMRTSDKSFEQIVFKVLTSMRDLQCLRKVSFSYDNQCDFVTFELPRSLLSCKTLVVLKLKGLIAIRVGSSSLEFLKLEVLHLSHVSFDGSSPNLLLCCPILREFVVGHACKSSGKVTVKSPALECLTYHDSNNIALAFENIDKLIQAYVGFTLDSTVEHWEVVLRIIQAARNVRLLDLNLMRFCTHRTQSFGNFPEFHNAVELKLETDCCIVLGVLLYKLPFLKKLTIVKAPSCHRCAVFGCRWSSPSQEVPICLSSNLSEFVFQEFQGFDIEMEFTGYVLKHSKAMQDVILTTRAWDEKRMVPVLKKLLLFKRASSRCRLSFVESTKVVSGFT